MFEVQYSYQGEAFGVGMKLTGNGYKNLRGKENNESSVFIQKSKLLRAYIYSRNCMVALQEAYDIAHQSVAVISFSCNLPSIIHQSKSRVVISGCGLTFPKNLTGVHPIQNLPEFRQQQSMRNIIVHNNFAELMSNLHPNTLQVIKKIQNYMFNLNHKIGQGSFSQVFRGTDISRNTPIAVKRIPMEEIKNKIATRLLESEISILKIVNHPNIIKCYDVNTSINNCYIIMELCEGDLDTQLRAQKIFGEEEVGRIVYAVFQALFYLANMNIIHRDLKVSNVFRSNGTYKLGDFGFAIKTTQMFKDIAIGSPIYMSPEGLINNIYGPKTDVWSFGLLIYELLHGTTPLASCKTEQELKRRVLQPPLIRKNLSPDIKELILNCLNINEKDRPSIEQIKESVYMRRLQRLINGQMDIEKDLTQTVNTTATNLSEITTVAFPPISYDNAVSLLHYCRLINKILITSSEPSQILSKWLICVSINLVRNQISMQGISPEKQTNLKDVIKEYNDKYIISYGVQAATALNYQQLFRDCEQKMQQQPKLSSHLRTLEKQSELLIYCLQVNCMQEFGRKSKARQYMSSLTTRQ